MISVNVRSEIPFSKNPHHRETSQPFFFGNQLAGFTKRYFLTDLRLLLTVMNYSQMTYNRSNYNGLHISE